MGRLHITLNNCEKGHPENPEIKRKKQYKPYIEDTRDTDGFPLIMVEYDVGPKLHFEERKRMELEMIDEINSVLFDHKFQLTNSYYNERDRITLYGVFRRNTCEKQNKAHSQTGIRSEIEQDSGSELSDKGQSAKTEKKLGKIKLDDEEEEEI
ncbi:hypothetical protein KPH14_001170 [Odynerus spinipes]|uniref:Uncharacterized protein n=1 Tax=Odynerus spinipes TaxID=1348599 RepID=A0AAD9RQ98_9HYME|nr:hypothetical protein KPH14_001170 [Odynerus spinipes]